MEQVTVTIYSEGEVVYDQVTAWIQVDNPMSWDGYVRADDPQPLLMTRGIGCPARFSLRTVDGHGGEIVITSANTQTREVHFEGDGPFGFLQ